MSQQLDLNNLSAHFKISTLHNTINKGTFTEISFLKILY